MAKLKAPLLSLGASGAIGKSLVFFGWKGIDAVREYVIPSNPKTAPQNTQRGYLTAAVAKIHATQALAVSPFDAEDATAYAALGSTRPTPRTWFNEIVKNWLSVKVAGKVPVIFHASAFTNKAPATICVWEKIAEETASQLAAAKFYFGTSKTALINSKAATVTAGDKVALVDENCSAFLTAGVKYFWQIRADSADPCEGAVSGIYHFVAT